MTVGRMLFGDAPVVGNQDRRTERLVVTSTSDRAIQITSHFHFFEVNRALRFDRRRAYGMHLDVPPGLAVRFEPGETRTVNLVEFGGERRIIDFNNLVNGRIADIPLDVALARARAAGFLAEEDESAV